MQKWEYKVVGKSIFTESEMNQLGNEGWELVAVTSHENTVTSEYYFKRPKT